MIVGVLFLVFAVCALLFVIFACVSCMTFWCVVRLLLLFGVHLCVVECCVCVLFAGCCLLFVCLFFI